MFVEVIVSASTKGICNKNAARTVTSMAVFPFSASNLILFMVVLMGTSGEMDAKDRGRWIKRDKRRTDGHFRKPGMLKTMLAMNFVVTTPGYSIPLRFIKIAVVQHAYFSSALECTRECSEANTRIYKHENVLQIV